MSRTIEGQLIDYGKQTVTLSDDQGNPTVTITSGYIDVVEFNRRLTEEGCDGIISDNPTQEEIEDSKNYIEHALWVPWLKKNGKWGWRAAREGDTESMKVTVMHW